MNIRTKGLVVGALSTIAVICLATTTSLSIEVPIEDAKFSQPIGPASQAVSVLWGDLRTGPSSLLVRMNKGTLPAHPHAADHHVVVVKGIMAHAQGTLAADGAKRFEPGSYWYQIKGSVRQEACLTDQCLIFIYFIEPALPDSRQE